MSSYDAVTFLEGLYGPDAGDAVVTLPAGAPHRGGMEVDIDDLPVDWRLWFEERAAIKEYDGGMSRELAEAEALAETVALMRQAEGRAGRSGA